MRKEKGMTLAKLSEITGLSQAIVSQIERGMANPSFTTLAQLAHGLDIPVGKFFIGQEESKSPVVRKSDRRNLKGVTRESVGEAVHELLTPDLNGGIEAQWIMHAPRARHQREPLHATAARSSATSSPAGRTSSWTASATAWRRAIPSPTPQRSRTGTKTATKRYA